MVVSHSHLSDVVPDVRQQGIIGLCQAFLKAAEAQVILAGIEAAEPQIGPHLCSGLTHLQMQGAGQRSKLRTTHDPWAESRATGQHKAHGHFCVPPAHSSVTPALQLATSSSVDNMVAVVP